MHRGQYRHRVVSSEWMRGAWPHLDSHVRVPTLVFGWLSCSDLEKPKSEIFGRGSTCERAASEDMVSAYKARPEGGLLWSAGASEVPP